MTSTPKRTPRQVMQTYLEEVVVNGRLELIEELADIGGGRGLFQGCAAGDTSMAVVVEVDERSA